MTRGRGLALLLALLYGVLSGAALAPLPAEAQPRAASFLSERQGPVALVAKTGLAALKAQRGSPDPVLLPEATAEIIRAAVRAPASPVARQRIVEPGESLSPYSARAPPAH